MSGSEVQRDPDEALGHSGQPVEAVPDLPLPADEEPSRPLGQEDDISAQPTLDELNPIADAPPPPPDIESLEGLLLRAYEQAGSKRLSVSKSAFHRLVQGLDNDVPMPDPLRELVASLADSDQSLAVPVRLLICVESSSPSHRLTSRVLEYVAIALRRHDAMRRSEVRRILDRETDDVDSALVSIRETVRDLPLEPLSEGVSKETLRRKLQLNATTSLLLWFSMTNRIEVSLFLDLLDRHVWSHELSATKVKSPRSLLSESKTPEVLGWLWREAGRRLREAQEVADVAERSAERARAREATLEGEMIQLRLELQRLEEELSIARGATERLRLELADTVQQRSIDKTHHVDDYKVLRSRVLRSLDKQSELLGNALHALRHDRWNVADEYVERSIVAIDQERSRLRELGEQ